MRARNRRLRVTKVGEARAELVVEHDLRSRRGQAASNPARSGSWPPHVPASAGSPAGVVVLFEEHGEAVGEKGGCRQEEEDRGEREEEGSACAASRLVIFRLGPLSCRGRVEVHIRPMSTSAPFSLASKRSASVFIDCSATVFALFGPEGAMRCRSGSCRRDHWWGGLRRGVSGCVPCCWPRALAADRPPAPRARPWSG
ncbi:DUF6354 family protein [Streptomyces sp. NPDC001568]|uniref:DUF6354 family protein n=1 Tax=Streptomyces sp. NPDC001568 TaxID=3364588 RepID=UPI0036A0E801